MTTAKTQATDEVQIQLIDSWAEALSAKDINDGKPLVTDGPFAETREQLGG